MIRIVRAMLAGVATMAFFAVAFFAVAFFGVAFSEAALAQSGAVAVVDTQKVLNESILGKAARSTVESQMKKGQGRLAQLKTDFDKQRADLQKQSAVLSGSALEDRKEALLKKERELERASEDIREEVMRKNDSEIGKVVAEISEIVQELASDKGYGFVFERDRQSVVYASDRIDITADVIKALDKKKIAL